MESESLLLDIEKSTGIRHRSRVESFKGSQVIPSPLTDVVVEPDLCPWWLTAFFITTRANRANRANRVEQTRRQLELEDDAVKELLLKTLTPILSHSGIQCWQNKKVIFNQNDSFYPLVSHLKEVESLLCGKERNDEFGEATLSRLERLLEYVCSFTNKSTLAAL